MGSRQPKRPQDQVRVASSHIHHIYRTAILSAPQHTHTHSTHTHTLMIHTSANRYASLAQLVRHMTDVRHADYVLREIFILTFPSFCTPSEFVTELAKRFKSEATVGSGSDDVPSSGRRKNCMIISQSHPAGLNMLGELDSGGSSVIMADASSIDPKPGASSYTER